MLKKNKKIVLSALVITLAALACNLPGGQPPTETPAGLSPEQLSGTATALALSPQTAAFTAIPGITETATVNVPPTACTPTVVANVNANVRSGPGTVYPQVGALLLGQSATVAGKNNEGSWWYIVFPAASGGNGWIAGSTVTSSCIPASVAVIAAPPLPTAVPPTATSIPPPAIVFAVTSVSFTNSGGCGNFSTTANITTNGAGTVTFRWIRSDGGIGAAPPALVFGAAGTQSVSTSWSTTFPGEKWFDIYIDTPNNQQFGRASFTCP